MTNEERRLLGKAVGIFGAAMFWLIPVIIVWRMLIKILGF